MENRLQYSCNELEYGDLSIIPSTGKSENTAKTRKKHTFFNHKITSALVELAIQLVIYKPLLP